MCRPLKRTAAKLENCCKYQDSKTIRPTSNLWSNSIQVMNLQVNGCLYWTVLMMRKFGVGMQREPLQLCQNTYQGIRLAPSLLQREPAGLPLVLPGEMWWN